MHPALVQCSVCGANAWGCANWSMTYGGWKTHLCGFLCEVCSAPSMGWLMPPAGMVYLPGEIEEMHQVVRVAGGHSIPQDVWDSLPVFNFGFFGDPPLLETSYVQEWARALADHRAQGGPEELSPRSTAEILRATTPLTDEQIDEAVQKTLQQAARAVAEADLSRPVVRLLPGPWQWFSWWHLHSRTMTKLCGAPQRSCDDSWMSHCHQRLLQRAATSQSLRLISQSSGSRNRWTRPFSPMRTSRACRPEAQLLLFSSVGGPRRCR